jgi:peptidyl-dipeptidase Dcp
MTEEKNPFLTPYHTLHDTTPFDRIRTEHFEPAMREGMQREEEEIAQITGNKEAPTFRNTIVALDRAGQLLGRVSTVFGNLLSAETSDALQEVAERMMPLLTEHSNNISLNEDLFARVKAVYEQRDSLNLHTEESMLLQKTYEGFVRTGANLSAADKETYRKISTELSMLTLRFSQNLLKETQAYRLILSEEQASQLPDSVREAFAQNARERGLEGYVVTLNAPDYVPFIKYCPDRELRRQIFLAYNTRCTHDNEHNNLDIVRQLVNLRLQRAQLLGYRTHADFMLDQRMAETKEAVYSMLNHLIEAYMPTARKEVAETEAMAREIEGDDFLLQPWDWAYYTEKLKMRKYQFDEEQLRPYFELSRVIDGVFGLATRLYGITFRPCPQIPVYHPDVVAYEVMDKDGKFLAVLYADFHPREGKRGGAWMTSYKEQWREDDGTDSRPHVSVTMNFTKPTAEKPALLSFSEVETFLHEFGHALHGMFADGTYAGLSGTNVYWDFVELPSQFMENYATEKEFLHTFARHYQTGELIPDEWIDRIIEASRFNVAYVCMRQVCLGLLDMAWYTRETPFEGDVIAYEHEAWRPAIMIPPAEGTCMTTQFSHIMAGGYSAGYYSYKWAEALDADAFSLFKERGIFDKATAESFRENILSKGGTEHPMTLYVRFRGKKPTIEALLRRNGIIK